MFRVHLLVLMLFNPLEMNLPWLIGDVSGPEYGKTMAIDMRWVPEWVLRS